MAVIGENKGDARAESDEVEESQEVKGHGHSEVRVSGIKGRLDSGWICWLEKPPWHYLEYAPE